MISTSESRIAEIRAFLEAESRAGCKLRKTPIWEDNAIRDLLAHIDAQKELIEEYRFAAHIEAREGDEARAETAKIQDKFTQLEAANKKAVEVLERYRFELIEAGNRQGIGDLVLHTSIYKGCVEALAALSAPSQPETPTPTEPIGSPEHCERMAKFLADRKDPEIWGAVGALNWAAKRLRELNVNWRDRKEEAECFLRVIKSQPEAPTNQEKL